MGKQFTCPSYDRIDIDGKKKVSKKPLPFIYIYIRPPWRFKTIKKYLFLIFIIIYLFVNQAIGSVACHFDHVPVKSI